MRIVQRIVHVIKIVLVSLIKMKIIEQKENSGSLLWSIDHKNLTVSDDLKNLIDIRWVQRYEIVSQNNLPKKNWISYSKKLGDDLFSKFIDSTEDIFRIKNKIERALKKNPGSAFVAFDLELTDRNQDSLGLKDLTRENFKAVLIEVSKMNEDLDIEVVLERFSLNPETPNTCFRYYYD
jgi:hypothetical protein